MGLNIFDILHLGLKAELETVVVVDIAHPGVAHAVGREADVVLHPNTFIFKGVHIGEITSHIPS